MDNRKRAKRHDKNMYLLSMPRKPKSVVIIDVTTIPRVEENTNFSNTDVSNSKILKVKSPIPKHEIAIVMKIIISGIISQR